MIIRKINLNFLITCFIVICFSINGTAQKTVKAHTILNDISKGKSVNYENVTITGSLDMTFMNEKLPDLPEKSKWWKNSGSNTIEQNIEGKITFVNCTFTDAVLAYIHDKDSGYTFIANFENEVIFKNCKFLNKALFKYSKFEEGTIFYKSKFKGESTFKYSIFDNKANFEHAVFEEDANFKYAKFNNGVTFSNVKFEGDLDIKYAKVRGDFEITKMHVAKNVDSKYTDINGSRFSKYLISNN
jgi:uncharacterized protein YjbI with pentapeptide repeats